jgi:hypothetical protein
MSRACHYAKGFSVREKCYAQATFWLWGLSGFFGLFCVDMRLAVFYLFVWGYGIAGIVMRHLVCPRCPHLWEYGDCLQLPVAATRRIVTCRKPRRMSHWEKSVFLGYFAFIALFPLYWVARVPALAIVFVLASAMWFAGQFCYFCKRCRVTSCPFNRTR